MAFTIAQFLAMCFFAAVGCYCIFAGYCIVWVESRMIGEIDAACRWTVFVLTILGFGSFYLAGVTAPFTISF